MKRVMKDLAAARCEGAGVVEAVLIIVVLIGLVLIFKTQLNSLLGTIFSQIESAASGVF